MYIFYLYSAVLVSNRNHVWLHHYRYVAKMVLRVQKKESYMCKELGVIQGHMLRLPRLDQK